MPTRKKKKNENHDYTFLKKKVVKVYFSKTNSKKFRSESKLCHTHSFLKRQRNPWLKILGLNRRIVRLFCSTFHSFDWIEPKWIPFPIPYFNIPIRMFWRLQLDFFFVSVKNIRYLEPFSNRKCNKTDCGAQLLPH